MATQILTPNIPSCTYSSLYLKHKVQLANPGISYGCNKLKPWRAEEMTAPNQNSWWFQEKYRDPGWAAEETSCSTSLAGGLCSSITKTVLAARGSEGKEKTQACLILVRRKWKERKNRKRAPCSPSAFSYTPGWKPVTQLSTTCPSRRRNHVLVCFSLGQASQQFINWEKLEDLYNTRVTESTPQPQAGDTWHLLFMKICNPKAQSANTTHSFASTSYY